MGIDVDDPSFSLKSILMDRAQTASSTILNLLKGALGNIAGIVMDGIVTFFALFFLLRDGERIRAAATRLLPIDPQTIERIFAEVGTTVVANMYGVGAVAITQGALTGLAFLALGLPSPVMWGLVAGLCSMIPLVGPPVVWGPAAIYLALTAQYGKAAILAGVGLGVIGLADNFIRPYIISGQTDMHPLLIFFALLGGAQSFGIMGLFIGPAVLSVTFVLLRMLHPAKGVAAANAAPDSAAPD
jgi:predicted PurR-regulated permease PerM